MDWDAVATLAVGVGLALFGSNLLSTTVLAWYSNRGRRKKLKLMEEQLARMAMSAAEEDEDDE